MSKHRFEHDEALQLMSRASFASLGFPRVSVMGEFTVPDLHLVTKGNYAASGGLDLSASFSGDIDASLSGGTLGKLQLLQKDHRLDGHVLLASAGQGWSPPRGMSMRSWRPVSIPIGEPH